MYKGVTKLLGWLSLRLPLHGHSNNSTLQLYFLRTESSLLLSAAVGWIVLCMRVLSWVDYCVCPLLLLLLEGLYVENYLEHLERMIGSIGWNLEQLASAVKKMKREKKRNGHKTQNTKHTMVAIEPPPAFSNISATTRPISTKFDEETVNEVDNYQLQFHCHWLEFRGIWWLCMVEARCSEVKSRENQRLNATNP